MASYTDQLPQFNPYIQQLPVEAMVQVGMEKQRRYDEGIQKIQTNIDNVAGLDIANPVQKEYLQSKLNELGSKLRTVAAGDFSNYQLVNSVGGMAKQIGKDTTIQNAVSSTAKYKKGLADMEQAIKEGKSSQANIYDFTQKANAYLNSNNVNASFSDRYTQYIDVDKKWLEVYKSLHADLREQDIPYVKNADGTIDYNKTAAAMQRVSKETVSAAKIENALRASLTPDELNQLAINAKYQFRAYDSPEKLSVYADTKYNSQIRQNESKIKELEGVIGLSTSNPEKQKQAQEAIAFLQEKNKYLNSELQEELKLINSDLDLAKTTIYKNGAISQFANAYAWENNKENLLSNPVLEAEHWEKNFALDRAKFDLDIRQQNWSEYADRRGWDFQQKAQDLANKEFELKYQKQMADMFGGSTTFETYKGKSTAVKAPLAAMLNDETMYRNAANEGISEMVKGIPGTTSAQIITAIDKYKNGDPNWYIVGNGNTKKAIPVEWRDEVNNIIDSQNKANRLSIGREKIYKEVDAEFAVREKEVYNKIASLPGVSVKDSSGRTVNFSAKEIANFIANQEVSQAPVTGGAQGAYMGSTSVRYRRPLTEKEKLLTQGLQGVNRQNFSNVSNIVSTGLGEIARQKEEKIQSTLLERNGSYVPRVTTISFSSEGGDLARRKWESITDAVLYRYSGEGGSKDLSKADMETARGWVSSDDREKVIYKKLTQGDKSFLILVKGGKEITIPLERTEARQLPIVDPNAPSEQYQDVVKAQYLGNGNTNPTGRYEDAYFGKPQMPNVGLDVKADLSWNKSNTAKQYIQLKLNTPNGVIPLQLDDSPLSRDRAVMFIEQLTKSQVKQLYLDSPLISERDKQVIKNL